MNLQDYLTEQKKLIDNYLSSIFEIDKSLPIIYEAMRYSLLAGGKRIRPILCLMGSELFDGSIKDTLPFACSIELIHTYSLIHDDLPAMDNDDFRRGKPTNHKVYGEGFAVLAGDGLLNKAFEIIVSKILENQSINYVKAANIICNASGINGMIGGQALDLYYENKHINADVLTCMHDKKTGALISAAITSGAVIAGCSEEDYNRLNRFGKLIGRAFQIADDILDVEGESKKLGKNIGSDINKHKSTYVTLYGVEHSKKLAKEIIDEAISVISFYGEKSFYFKELAKFIISRDV